MKPVNPTIGDNIPGFDLARYQSDPDYQTFALERMLGVTQVDTFEGWLHGLSGTSSTSSAPGPAPPRSASKRKAVGSAGAGPGDVPSASAGRYASATTSLRPDATPSCTEDDGGISKMLASLSIDAAASIAAEPPLFQEVRALASAASAARVERLCTHLEKSKYHQDDNEAQAIMDWVGLLRDIKSYGPGMPFPVALGQLKMGHYMAGSIVKTTLLDENVKTPAQMLALEPPEGTPTNRSYFAVTPITFAYNAQRYQTDFNYRHWVGERALGMTETTGLDAWHKELDKRFHNRPLRGPYVDPNPGSRLFVDNYDGFVFYSAMQRTNRQINAMVQARNAALPTQTSGWTKNPGVVGPALDGSVIALPKLPEMHTGTAGEAPPDNEWLYVSQTERFPMARNWNSGSEIFLHQMTLRTVDPREFRQPPKTPEVLFTDRFGVTMQGVSQTSQCSHQAEHDIFTGSIATLHGYDQTLASHGIVYEDYRRMIEGMLSIIRNSCKGPQGATNAILTGSKIKKFFESVSENLRARGAPVVIKYKKDSLYQCSQLSIRHHPFGLPIRGRLGKHLNQA